MEGLQEPYVAGVGVPHQVQHRVGDRHPAVVRGQHPVGPGGDVGRDRGDARRVQDGQVAEPAGRPADLDPVHVGGGQLAEVDLERAALPRPRPGHRGPLQRVDHHLRGWALGVPGDDLGALARVGRGQLLAEQRVEQGGLAGLDLAGDGQPERPVQPVPGLGQARRVPRRRPRWPRRGPAARRSTRPESSATRAHQLPRRGPHLGRGGGPPPPARAPGLAAARRPGRWSAGPPPAPGRPTGPSASPGPGSRHAAGAGCCAARRGSACS